MFYEKNMEISRIFEEYSKVLKGKYRDSPEDSIFFHQAIYRFFAIDRPDWLVLHGSAISCNGSAIVFGDDGSSLGKTSNSLQAFVDLKRKGYEVKYIADEFLLFHEGNIYPNPFYPIHVKPTSKIDMENLFGFYTEFLELPEMRYAKEPVMIANILCPKPGEKSLLRQYKGQEAQKALHCTAYAHCMKLLNPSFDRNSLFKAASDIEVKNLKGYTYNSSRNPLQVPIWELQIAEYSDLIDLLEGEQII